MKSAVETSVVSAVRIRGHGVIIEFDDGTSALYSASLLRSMLPQGERMKSQPRAASFPTASEVKNPEQSRAKYSACSNDEHHLSSQQKPLGHPASHTTVQENGSICPVRGYLEK
jgi:hypothetical protein